MAVISMVADSRTSGHIRVKLNRSLHAQLPSLRRKQSLNTSGNSPPEGSSPCSQIPAICSYSDSEKLRPQKLHIFLSFQKIIVNIFFITPVSGSEARSRQLARPRRRWTDNIKMDFGQNSWSDKDCIGVAQDRDVWKDLVNAVMILRVQSNPG
jgi:hypothetical protein